MKKKIIIISLIVIIIIIAYIIGFYIYVNYRDTQISLISENVIIEYGESYNPTINDLIDLDKYSFINLDKFSIKNEIVNEDEKEYAKVGEYTIQINYKNIELVQNVEVKDSTSPEIIIDEKIEVPYNTDLENYDFKDYIKINDLSETKEYNIDFSNVNREVVGEYKAIIKAQDIYDNITEKEFNIIIQDKIEETTTNEIPSNNATKETSNQEKAQSNSKTQTSNKTSTTNNNSNSRTSSNNKTESGETTTNNNTQTQATQTITPSDLEYWCVAGGSHHIAGDGSNEHGYYSSWNEAYQAFESYTKGWKSVQYKISQCSCGLYYFWAIE